MVQKRNINPQLFSVMLQIIVCSSIYTKESLSGMSKESISGHNQRRMVELATFLRELRINSGYTQEQVAKEIQLSRTSISKIERMGYFRIQHLFILADFYEIPINQLFAEIE